MEALNRYRDNGKPAITGQNVSRPLSSENMPPRPGMYVSRSPTASC
jgi:hypothetical protein